MASTLENGWILGQAGLILTAGTRWVICWVNAVAGGPGDGGPGCTLFMVLHGFIPQSKPSELVNIREDRVIMTRGHSLGVEFAKNEGISLQEMRLNDSNQRCLVLLDGV